MNPIVNKYSGFIFDLDGTIYRGGNLISKADLVINSLQKLNKKVIFISNKTTGTAKSYYNFLIENGIITEERLVINATKVIIRNLQKSYANCRFYSISEKVFVRELEKAGFVYCENPEEIDVLIVTLDRSLNYKKLEIAATALEMGARFFAANIDDTCPVEEGEILDAGSIISALEKRTHKKLEKHFGKPSEYMLEMIRETMGIDLKQCLIIGDRLETDIALGYNNGIDTALVTTGIINYDGFDGKIKPTFNLTSISDFL